MVYRGVWYIEVYGISRCMVYRGVCYIEVYGISRCTVYRGVCYIEVYGISRCMLYRSLIVSRSEFVQGLQSKDEIVQFGSLHVDNFKDMKQVAEIVQNSANVSFPSFS